MQHISEQYRKEKDYQLVEIIENLEEHAEIARSLGFVGLVDMPKSVYSAEHEEFPLYFLLGYKNIEGMILSLKARLELNQQRPLVVEKTSNTNDVVFENFSEEVWQAIAETPLGVPEEFTAVKFIPESTTVTSKVNRFLFASLTTVLGFLIGAGVAIYRHEQSRT